MKIKEMSFIKVSQLQTPPPPSPTTNTPHPHHCSPGHPPATLERLPNDRVVGLLGGGAAPADMDAAEVPPHHRQEALRAATAGGNSEQKGRWGGGVG